MEKVSDVSLKAMRESTGNHEGTRWAAYRNSALDSSMLGTLQFLAVGPHNTFSSPPESYPHDGVDMGWKYRFEGWVDLVTGETVKE